MFKSCMTAHREANGARAGPGGRGGRSGGYSNWFGGAGGSRRTDRDDRPPPYYRKDSAASSSDNAGRSWMPGFWTGLGLGGLAASLWNGGGRQGDAAAVRRAREQLLRQQQQEYDWERPRPASSSWFSDSGSVPRQRYQPMETESDGAGPSGLGQTRRSTAIANSHVR